MPLHLHQCLQSGVHGRNAPLPTVFGCPTHCQANLIDGRVCNEFIRCTGSGIAGSEWQSAAAVQEQVHLQPHVEIPPLDFEVDQFFAIGMSTFHINCTHMPYPFEASMVMQRSRQSYWLCSCLVKMSCEWASYLVLRDIFEHFQSK